VIALLQVLMWIFVVNLDQRHSTAWHGTVDLLAD